MRMFSAFVGEMGNVMRNAGGDFDANFFDAETRGLKNKN